MPRTSVAHRWFCHVDDDNYVNPRSLLHLLSSFSPSQDVYLGRPSLDHPIEATERVQGGRTVSARADSFLDASPGGTAEGMESWLEKGIELGVQADPPRWFARGVSGAGQEALTVLGREGVSGPGGEGLETMDQWPAEVPSPSCPRKLLLPGWDLLRGSLRKMPGESHEESGVRSPAPEALTGTPSPGDHGQVLVCYWWGRVLPQQRPRPQDEPVGQVSGGSAAWAGRRRLRPESC